jgi:hypothetical protein
VSLRLAHHSAWYLFPLFVFLRSPSEPCLRSTRTVESSDKTNLSSTDTNHRVASRHCGEIRNRISVASLNMFGKVCEG